jgi:hypothetical protein
MGYTHYWYRPPAIEAAAFARITADVRRLLPALADRQVRLAGPDGTGAPIVTAEDIAFNGLTARNEDGEAFWFPRVRDPRMWERPGPDGRFFAFCKTGRAPYDLAVQATLIVVAHHVPAVGVTSDGTRREWARARDLCQERLGYGAAFAFMRGRPGRSEGR